MKARGLNSETKVGALFAGAALLLVAFAWLVGVRNPFARNLEFYVTYRFAGGIDVGSPVRVSGIKVGRVEKIDFFVPDAGSAVGIQEPGTPDDLDEDSAVAPVRLKLSVRKDAAAGIRQDSRFYINLAGIIGERYIEITPGSRRSPVVGTGTTLAGVDPPRIDQLLSQSFDLAGKIADLIEKNKGDLSRSLELLYKLSGNLNKTLSWVDKSAVFKTDLAKLVDNLIAITSDVRRLTDKLHDPQADKTLALLHELLWRLEPLDSKNIRAFLQKEGVKVQFF